MRAPWFIASLLFIALAVGACAGPQPAGSPGPSGDPPAEPIEGFATHDAVQVGLVVDRARVAPGGDVRATVVVRNGAPGVVTWQGGGCDLQGNFTVTPLAPVAPGPAGPAWPGDRGVIKELALPDASAIRIPVPPEFAHEDVAFGCTSDLRFNELQPGAETRASVVWVAATAAGAPVPAGDYEVAVTFPYLGRGLAGPPMDFEFDDVTPVTARLVVTVEAGPPVPSAADAMDAVLGDPAFAAALETHPRRIWDSTAMRWKDGTWVVQVRYQPGGLLEGWLDPMTGAVVVRDGLEGARLR